MRNKIGHTISFAAGSSRVSLYMPHMPRHRMLRRGRSGRCISSCRSVPASGADIGARLLADRLTKRWGQTRWWSNRPGGDGVVAINTVLNARDDHMCSVGHPPRSLLIPTCMTRCPTIRAQHAAGGTLLETSSLV